MDVIAIKKQVTVTGVGYYLLRAVNVHKLLLHVVILLHYFLCDLILSVSLWRRNLLLVFLCNYGSRVCALLGFDTRLGGCCGGGGAALERTRGGSDPLSGTCVSRE